MEGEAAMKSDDPVELTRELAQEVTEDSPMTLEDQTESTTREERTTSRPGCSITRGSVSAGTAKPPPLPLSPNTSTTTSTREGPTPRELPPTLQGTPLLSSSDSARETSITFNSGMQVHYYI